MNEIRILIMNETGDVIADDTMSMSPENHVLHIQAVKNEDQVPTWNNPEQLDVRIGNTDQ